MCFLQATVQGAKTARRCSPAVVGEASSVPGDPRAGPVRDADYLAANPGSSPLVVLTEGFQSAFVACVVVAALGLTLALALLGRARQSTPSLAADAPQVARQ
jgi:hypothetical protein